MKTRQLYSALVTGAFSLCFAMQAQAQDPLVHITGPANASLDYMTPTNEYVLSGVVSPTTVGGWSNVASFGFLPRIQLQVLDNPMLNSMWYKTYCTAQELMDVQEGRCSALSVAFYQSDAKQTSDHGFILCGYVVRDAEYTSCPGPGYINPYLIKTDAMGNVMWYKRYNSGYDNRTRFYSVVENYLPAGGFIVCGETTPGFGIMPTGFMMGTTPAGNVMWANNTMTTRWGDPTTPETCTYTEVTPFTDMGGNKYFVLTGPVGYGFYYGYGINTGGGLLTVIQPNGAIVNNVFLTEDPYNRFMQLRGVNDAHDGDVVLTGFEGINHCGTHGGFNMLIMKVNPLTLVTKFMESFETNPTDMYDQSFGNSITVNTAHNVISVAGYQNSGGNFALYVETDYTGTLLRYAPHNPADAYEGRAVVYNTIKKHTAYSGVGGPGTFVVKDKYGVGCIPDVTPIVDSWVNDVVYNSTTPPAVMEISEALMAMPMPNTQALACGTWKPGKSTPEKQIIAVANMAVLPNPAENYIDVQLPDQLKNGTVKIYDMTGRLISSAKAGDAASTVHVNINTLATGVYMVTAENNGVKQHSTFVKQ